jgi:hypothetical protein
MLRRIAFSSSRRPATAALAALVSALGPDASAAAQASVAAGVSTPGRAGAAMAAAVGLVSLVAGGLALRAARGRSPARVGVTGAAAVAVGLTGLALATQHLARFTGGFGTGDGRAGAIVAIVAALVGATLGTLALVRVRRAG